MYLKPQSPNLPSDCAEEVPTAPRPGPSVFDTDSFGEGDMLEPVDEVAARYEATVAGTPLATPGDGPLVTDTIGASQIQIQFQIEI
jgi:hypothetical protein